MLILVGSLILKCGICMISQLGSWLNIFYYLSNDKNNNVHIKYY